MSKQSFTTGQVLTAAQVNSLQANDYNQTVSVKTAAYTLVAADKGTRIEFNTSGSVTCTVNSGLFDAGDTLVIQNRGAGVVTVTPGTATVNTSATLALSQYDAGTLYFISDSASIFFNTDAGGGSPLTTKGDLYGFSTVDARIPIGANDTVLTADSNESLGLKWAAASSGALALVSRQSFSGVADTGTTFDGVFTSTYKNYQIVIEDIESTTNNTFLYLQYRYAGPTTQASAYYGSVTNFDHNGTTTNTTIAGANQISVMKIGSTGSSTNGQVGNYYVSKVGASGKPAITGQGAGNATTGAFNLGCTQDTARTYTGFILSAAAGNITGTVSIYGLATA